MKRIGFLLLFSLLFLLEGKAQVMMPVYDKAKHYQLRSMEKGPWAFHPPGWYYSWWSKDVKILWGLINFGSVRLPGLGFHDNGPAGVGIGGDHYVTRYQPNVTQRTAMLLVAKKTKEKYEESSKAISEIHQRELANIADRTVDIVNGDIDPVIIKLNLIFVKQMAEYVKLRGRDKTYTILNTERQKIDDTIAFMHKNYVKNADREKAYRSQLKQYEELIVKVKNILKSQYAYQMIENIQWKNF